MNKLLLVMTVGTLLLSGQKGARTDLQLQAAINKETVEGDLKGAIELYKKVAQSADRSVAAKALVRMGECYEKLGDTEARKAYERVVRDFGDQKEAADQARAHLGRTGLTVRGSGIATRQVWTGSKVDFDGTVSPDGRLLSFVDWETGDLAIHDLVTGEDRRLTHKGPRTEPNEFAEESAISPDGKQVVYAWFNKLFYELRLMDLNGAGGKFRTLFRKEDVRWIVPAWTPDGKWIAVYLWKGDPRAARTYDMGLVAVADGSLRILRRAGQQTHPTMAFSPDGKFLAHNIPAEGKSDRDVFLMATDGSQETPLVVHPADDSVLGWTPDGKYLLFASDRTGTMSAWALPVSAGKAQGAPVLIKKDIGRPDAMGVTRSGSLLFGVRTEGSDVVSTASIDLETGKLLAPPAITVQEFVGPNRMPDWSRDGKYLAYLTSRDDATVLGIRSLETGTTRELRFGLKDLWGTKWAPDGRSIGVRATGSGDREGIYRIDVQTGEATPLVLNEPGVRLGRPWWSPDGSTLYYARSIAQDRAILARDLASGRERDVIRWKAPSFGLMLDLSPDGRQFAVTTQDQASKSTSILVVPTDGGEPRELLRLRLPEERVISGAWSADSKLVVFNKGQSDRDKLWVIPAAGGEPRELEMSSAKIGNFVIHPDGHRIAYTSNGVGKREVWALENFLPKLSASR